jgi:RNA polymerase sigma-70 factor (ECF subfamily)
MEFRRAPTLSRQGHRPVTDLSPRFLQARIAGAVKGERNVADAVVETPSGEDPAAAVAQHIVALRRYARSLVRNSSEADDLVQECLARALARLRVWHEVRDLRAYLFTILNNVHLDTLAHRKRSGNVVPIDEAVANLSCRPNQVSRIEANELSEALERIPEEQRRVVLLVGIGGMKYHEIASMLGIPIGTVMSRLSRGRETLRRMLAGEELPSLKRADG